MQAIDPEHRPLFERLHGLVLAVAPDAEVELSYNMPAYRMGGRRLNMGAWKHGVSIYGFDKPAGAAFTDRHPGLRAGKGTIRIRPRDATAITDDELRELFRASLGV